MQKLAAALACLLMSTPAPAEAVPSAARVAELARSALKETGAKGLAVAVIDDGQVACVQAFGAPATCGCAWSVGGAASC